MMGYTYYTNRMFDDGYTLRIFDDGGNQLLKGFSSGSGKPFGPPNG